MTQFFPLRTKPHLSGYKKNDVLVLFGELFNRGYANGLVEEAERQGMTVVRATVGRRDKEGQLRALTPEEMATIPQPFINVPLEAGFDMEPDSQDLTPCDQLKDIKLSNWEEAQLNWTSIEESKQKSIQRFRNNTSEFLKQLEPHIPAGANVLFAHLMAGGVPRAKILMPLLNRIFKGKGDRHIPSKTLIDSQIGQLCLQNFNEVTAETFHHLIDLSTPLRQKLESRGGRVAYTAYGYHGTEILIRNQYKWQTYTSYVQGLAKMALEKISENYFKQGVHCCVYNCPEILTNSSSVFQGVELSLYPLLLALKKENCNTEQVEKIHQECQQLLKDEFKLDDVQKVLDIYLNDDVIVEHCKYEQWPQNSIFKQMELMLTASDTLFAMHKDEKNLITAILSEVVFNSCGYVMLHDSWKPAAPVAWISHDLVARCL